VKVGIQNYFTLSLSLGEFLFFLFLTGFAELRHDSVIFKQAWMALAAPSLGASFPLPLGHLAR